APAIGIWVENEERQRVFQTSTDRAGGLRPLAAGERAQMTVRAHNALRSGHYYVGVSVGRVSGGEELDALDRATDFIVSGGDHLGGMVELRHDVEVSSAPEVSVR